MRNGKEKREGKAEGKGDEWDGVEKGRKGHPPSYEILDKTQVRPIYRIVWLRRWGNSVLALLV